MWLNINLATHPQVLVCEVIVLVKRLPRLTSLIVGHFDPLFDSRRPYRHSAVHIFLVANLLPFLTVHRAFEENF